MSKWTELAEELHRVVSGRGRIADVVIPPLVFVGGNSLVGIIPASLLALSAVLTIATFRVVRRKPLRLAAAGLGGTALAIAFAVWWGDARAFFVPGVVFGLAMATVAAVSTLAGRPIIAVTSALVRRWPLRWYRHPRVLPAYREATWMWALFFAGRAALQWRLLDTGDLAALAAVRILAGWPAILVMLTVTYLYGTARLVRLGGPSVEEFRGGLPGPWRSQRRGF